MPIAQKFVAGLVATMMITTLILPKRQTPAVINALTKFVRGASATAMGTGKAV
jgi:hypothetical protein